MRGDAQAARAALEIHDHAPRLDQTNSGWLGNAEKHQVQEMVRILLSLKALPNQHDAADAPPWLSVIFIMRVQ